MNKVLNQKLQQPIVDIIRTYNITINDYYKIRCLEELSERTTLLKIRFNSSIKYFKIYKSKFYMPNEIYHFWTCY
jgi:hypothetical protein